MQGPPFQIISICKGGGYRYCRTSPAHPRANSAGLYPLHRVLMENQVGRLLESNEVVHHIDEDRSNDDISNLELLSRSDHSRHHMKPVEPTRAQCAICETWFEVAPHHYRARVARSHAGTIACSRRCGRKMQMMTLNSRVAA